MKKHNPRFLISVAPPVRQCLRQYVRRTGRTTTGYVRQLIYLFINEHFNEFAKEVDLQLAQKVKQIINQ